jgi:ADP-ribose pyrophosphatase YjhB (NUDIX family)
MADSCPPGPPAHTPDAGDRPLRRAARVLLVDPQERVLLLRYDDDPPNGVHWSTPGGGLNPGEDYPAAAARELTEETGWTDIELLGEVFEQTRELTFGGRPIRQHERFYLARTDQPAREIRGVDAMHASDGIAAWRWWTLAELAATDAVILPPGLAGLTRDALDQAARGGAPPGGGGD